jgi:hypothetical protein
LILSRSGKIQGTRYIFFAIGSCVLAAISAFVDWTSYLYCILGVMIVRVIAQNTGNKKTNEIKSDEIDEGNK